MVKERRKEKRLIRWLMGMARMTLVFQLSKEWQKHFLKERISPEELLENFEVLLKVTAEFFPGISPEVLEEWASDSIKFIREREGEIILEVLAALLVFGGYISLEDILHKVELWKG